MSDEKEKAILIYELLKDIKQEETKSINELNPISNYVSSANYTYMKSNSYEDMILEIISCSSKQNIKLLNGLKKIILLPDIFELELELKDYSIQNNSINKNLIKEYIRSEENSFLTKMNDNITIIDRYVSRMAKERGCKYEIIIYDVDLLINIHLENNKHIIGG